MANFNYNNNSRNWKKPKEQTFHGGSKPRSFYSRKPSFGNGYQQSMLQLEEKFCSAVGGVSLRKVMEIQKYMHQDEKVAQKVIQWEDSAVKEAFWNAKKRFFAKMYSEPCDIKLPDPDIFIDKIDWDSSVDPKLMSDLEKEPDLSCETENRDCGVVVGIPTVSDQYVLTPTGWGDEVEVNPELKNDEKRDNNGNGNWVDNGVNMAESGWSKGLEDNYGYATASNGYRKPWDHGQRKHHDHANWDHGYNRKLVQGGWNTSRYKISRYQHNNNDQRFVDDYGSKKGNFSYERPLVKWKPVTSRS